VLILATVPAGPPDAGELHIVLLVEFELQSLERPARQYGKELARALEHGCLFLPPVTIDRPLQ
jgi:hypothetical protein